MASSSIDVSLVIDLGVMGPEKLCSDMLKGAGREMGDAPLFGRGWSGATRPELAGCATSVSYIHAASLDRTQLLHGVSRLQRILRFRQSVQELRVC